MGDQCSNELFKGERGAEDIVHAIKNRKQITVCGHSIHPVKEFVPVFLQCLRKQLLTRIGSPMLSIVPNSAEKHKKASFSSKQGKVPKYSPLDNRSSPIYSSKGSSFNRDTPLSKSDDRSRRRRNNQNSGTKRDKQFKGQRIQNISPSLGNVTSPESPAPARRRITPIKLSLDDPGEFPSLEKKEVSAPKQSNAPPRRITPTTFVSSSSNNNNLGENKEAFGNAFTKNTTKENALLENAEKISQLETKMQQYNNTTTTTKEECSDKCLSGPKGDEISNGKLSLPNKMNSGVQNAAKRIQKEQFSISNKETSISIKNVLDFKTLNTLIDVYVCIILEKLVSNLMLELNFLFQVMLVSEKQATDANPETMDIFVPLANCIYFAVKSLEKVKRVITLLEKSTLHLMVGNERIREFSPDLHKEISAASEEKDDEREADLQSFRSPLTGVPFRAESDIKKMFLSDRHFYSFSKQRDHFYSLLREWEENRFNADWSIEASLDNKIRGHFQMFRDHPNHVQFADLFTRQLVETCNEDSLLVPSADSDVSLGFLDVLKKSDPERYQRLQERFTAPNKSAGPCPSPQFTNLESFFQKFICIADSYVFTKNLADSLTKRICEFRDWYYGIFNELMNIDYLMCSSAFDDDSDLDIGNIRGEFRENLKEVRLLGKFLGYITFLPYNVNSSQLPKHYHLQNMDRRMQTQEFFDPTGLLLRAIENKRQILTIPWIVDFLCMIDSCSCTIKPYDRIFGILLSIYRSLKITGSDCDLNQLFLLLLLGWLFESSSISKDFYHHEVSTSSVHPESNASKEQQSAVPLDTIPIVTKSLLYSHCPFLHDLKSQLIDAMKGDRARAGSFRKITPISALEEKESSDDKDFLRMQLVDNFFRYQPKFLKETTDFITDRAFNNIKTVTISTIAADIKDTCGKNFEQKISMPDEVSTRPHVEQVKAMNDILLQNELHDWKDSFLDQTSSHCMRYCTEKLKDAFTSLLPEDVLQAVHDTAWKISRKDLIDKTAHWAKSYYKETLEGELRGLFHREIMQRIKRDQRSTSSEFESKTRDN